MEGKIRCIVCSSPEIKFYTKIEDDAIEDIILSCKNEHERSIKDYIEKGAISKKDAGILAGQAQEGIELIREARNRPFRASDLTANSEVIAQGWPCVRCNNLAEWAPPGNTKKQNRALCLPCRANWMSWGRKKEISAPGRTHGRPADLFGEIQFQRFLNNTDPIVDEATELLLEDCRDQAKRSKNSDEEFVKKASKDPRYTS
ncbi:MAG: hypothetical protein KJI69_01710 [Patescibacteria group bacterium]|nr:hypothetical protein [Patescibacteria group bacterium]